MNKLKNVSFNHRSLAIQGYEQKEPLANDSYFLN